jgi:hypothetical protein
MTDWLMSIQFNSIQFNSIQFNSIQFDEQIIVELLSHMLVIVGTRLHAFHGKARVQSSASR